MRKLHLILFLGSVCLAACSKSISEEDNAANQKAKDFQAAVLSNKYKIVGFYADKPIDYISNDTEVKSETDLWAYVKPHIMDDENLFGANKSLTIYQRNSKIAGNESETVSANYEIFAKGQDVAVNFIDYSYKSLEYRLHEFDNAYFTVYVDGPNGSKLFTKFARVE